MADPSSSSDTAPPAFAAASSVAAPASSSAAAASANARLLPGVLGSLGGVRVDSLVHQFEWTEATGFTPPSSVSFGKGLLAVELSKVVDLIADETAFPPATALQSRFATVWGALLPVMPQLEAANVSSKDMRAVLQRVAFELPLFSFHDKSNPKSVSANDAAGMLSQLVDFLRIGSMLTSMERTSGSASAGKRPHNPKDEVAAADAQLSDDEDDISAFIPATVHTPSSKGALAIGRNPAASAAGHGHGPVLRRPGPAVVLSWAPSAAAANPMATASHAPSHGQRATLGAPWSAKGGSLLGPAATALAANSGYATSAHAGGASDTGVRDVYAADDFDYASLSAPLAAELQLTNAARYAPIILRQIGGADQIIQYVRTYDWSANTRKNSRHIMTEAHHWAISIYLQARSLELRGQSSDDDIPLEQMVRRLYGLFEFDTTGNWTLANTYFLEPVGSRYLLPHSIRYMHLKQVADIQRARNTLDSTSGGAHRGQKSAKPSKGKDDKSASGSSAAGPAKGGGKQ
jgi:hypothetical protein